MTDEELLLWNTFLKGLPVTVHRQKVIGPYIVDFYIAKAKLVIELDGGQHYEETAIEKDRIRDEFFAKNGYRVLRFTNTEVRRRYREVCEEIWRVVTSSVSFADNLICPSGTFP